MKKFVFALFALMLMASVATAQMNIIGVFADPGATICDAPIAPGGMSMVYFVATLDMTSTTAITAAEFRTENFPQHGAQAMVTFSWASNLVIVEEGSTEIGVSIAFTEAQAGPIVALGNAMIVPFGNFWGENTFCRILEHGVSGMLSFVDDNYVSQPASGYNFVWNCTGDDFACDCISVPAQEKSFSSIKALY
ncbi:MAG: hypothetical protein GY835_07045 [bacterium]|nr:hypothetical protein [bacterium]